MNIKKRIYKGTMWGIIANINIFIFSFFTVIILARWLGPSEYGFLPLTLSITTVLGFFAVGIGHSAAKFIAEYSAKDNGYIRSIIKDSMFLILVFGTLISFMLFILSEKIALLLGEPKLSIFLKIGAFLLLSSSFVNYLNKIFEGFQRVDLNALRITIESISRTILPIGLVLFGYGAIGAYMGYAVSSILAALIGLFILYHKFYKKLPSTTKSIRRDFYKYNIPIIAIYASDLIITQIDIILIGYFLSTDGVAFYSIPKKIIESLNIPATSLGAAVAPAIAHNRANNKDDINKKIFYDSIKYLIILLFPVVIGLAILSDSIITLFLGIEFSNSIELLRLLAFLLIIYTIGNFSNSVLLYLGKAGIRAKLFGITTILTLVLYIILIPIFGAKGAIYATIITYLPYMFLVFKICLNELNIKPSTFIPLIIRVAFSSFFMGFVLLYFFRNIQNISGLLLAVATGGIIYVMLIFILRLITLSELKKMIMNFY